MAKRNQDFIKILNEFCLDVYPHGQLVEVPVVPESDAKPGFCSPNVMAKVLRDGGEAISGWDITWEEDGLLEAECHAIWKSPRGALTDVTPRASGDKVTLFLPQPGIWEGNRFISNKRRALADTQRSRALFMLAEMQDELKLRSWTGKQWVLSQDEYFEIWSRAAKIMFGVPEWHNCPCGNPSPFGKCCGRPKGRPWRNFRAYRQEVAA